MGCCVSQKVSFTAIQESWESIKPFALAGIATADIGPLTRAELLNEAEELSKSIAKEVSLAAD